MSGKPTYEELEKKVIELEESKVFFENLLDNLPELVSYVDENHTFKFGNKAYRKFFNIDPDSMIGQHPRDVLGNEAFEEVAPRHKAALSGQEQEYESSFLLPNGDPYYFHAHYLPHKEKGQTKGFLAVVQDITDRKKAEDELRISEQKFRNLAENVPGLVLKYRLNPDGSDELLYISKSVEDIFEVSQEDAFNNNKLLWDRIHRDDLKEYVESIKTSAENVSLWEQEHRIQLPGGRVKWLYTRGFPIQMDDGSVIWNTIAMDITEHKKAQALLEEKDKALRLSLDAARAGTWTWDVKTDEVVWDEQMQKIFGLEPGTFDGTFEAWKQRVHPEDVKLAEQITLNALNTGISYEHEYRVKGLSGDWRWVNAQAATLLDENRTPIRMSGFAVDITDRKLAEEKLRESEAKYRMLFENAEDAIFVADPDTGYLLDVNKKAEELTGYNRALLIGKHQTFIHPSEDADFYEKEFQKSIKSEGVKFREMLVQTSNGLNVPVEISAGGTIQSAEGKLHIGIFRNISERKQAERALKDSEERFRLAMEFANDGLYDWNLETNEIYYSPGWKKMLGYQDDELPNDFSIWQTLTDPQDVKRSWTMQKELINKKRDRFEIEFKMRHKDGNWVDVLSRANAIFDESGKAVRIIGTHVDISDRKKAETALKESEQKYRHLIQTASDAIYLISETGRFVDVNTAACNMLDRRREEILNLDISVVDPNFSVEAFFEFWKETPLSEPRIFETTHLHKDGSLVPVEVGGQKFKVGNDVLFFGIARNISERKKAEAEHAELQAELAQAHKMEAIGNLAGGIAHEFNNVLGIIMGNAELALDDVPEWNPAKESLREIRKASFRAKDVVRQILSFARKTMTALKPLEINTVVKESLKLMRASIPAMVDIQPNIPSEPSMILGDPTEIHQIVINLCTNAAHAMKASGGTLEVGISEVRLDESTASRYEDFSAGDFLKLTFRDSGEGIAPDVLEKVFEPYFTTKEFGAGSGMGLAVVYGIVKKCKGAIRIESTVGKGTTVEILFPKIEEEVPAAERKKFELPAGNERVLLVDDDSSIVNMIRQMLERLGYFVTSVTDSNAALAHFKSAPDDFDLVITDMAMPNMSGDQLAAELIKVRKGIPILLCTGHSDTVDEKKAKEIGIKGFAMKPLDKSKLARAVRAALDDR